MRRLLTDVFYGLSVAFHWLSLKCASVARFFNPNGKPTRRTSHD